MFGKNSSARLDLFVVTDAVLISLACMLIYMAYKEVNNAPVRHAQEMAVTISLFLDDFQIRCPFRSEDWQWHALICRPA
ncbi:MAG: hypothetical protein R3D29_09720 [Nitratireductor sp.]